jgi:hypothetical protein
MSEQHYILIPHTNHSPKIEELIKKGLLKIGKSYPIHRTPTMYDPKTFTPVHRWIVTLCNVVNSSNIPYRTILIEKEELEQSFSTLQNWRNHQISKLTGELPNTHLIEYINYLTQHLLIIKKELIKNPLKDHNITQESEIIGKQIKIIKEKLLIDENPSGSLEV